MAKKRKHERASIPQPITLQELYQRLADPDVPEKELLPYLTVDRKNRIGLAPVLLPSELVLADADDRETVNARARGDIGLGFLNRIYQARRIRAFERNLGNNDGRPILLAEGDSWFQYPIFREDVIDVLDAHYNIYCLSAAGDELKSIVATPEYRDHLRQLIVERNLNIRAFLFSAGGNDIVGAHLAALLNQFQSGQPASAHVVQAALETKVAEVESGYRAVLDAVHALVPNIPILIHGYDYAIPKPDQGFNVPPLDGWLGDPMRSKGIPDGALQAQIVRLLIDRFDTALASFDSGQPGGRPNVHFIDNRNTVGARWADELHPTDAGFADVAGRFRAKLTQLGIS